MPRVVLGLPMYQAEDFLAATLDSLVSMDYDDFAIVAIDDRSSDATSAIARRYAESDPRIVVEVNPTRLGMIENWNRVFLRAGELFDSFDYFAWASDNDLRDPGWLSALVRALDDNPTAILAYSAFGTLEERTPSTKWVFDSRSVADPSERFRAALNGMPVGAMMYGLHRRGTLESRGRIPRVVASDVLFLAHLSLFGGYLQESSVTWYRGARRTGGKMRRHRAALFAGRPPLWAFLSVEIQHTLWLFRVMVFGNQRPSGMSRSSAAHLCMLYLRTRSGRRLRRQRVTMARKRRRRKAARRKWVVRRVWRVRRLVRGLGSPRGLRQHWRQLRKKRRVREARDLLRRCAATARRLRRFR